MKQKIKDQMNNKDCVSCVYGEVCEGRRHNPLITDCCVPEKPLRELQDLTKTVEEFAIATHAYINSVKSKSKYWSEIIQNNHKV